VHTTEFYRVAISDNAHFVIAGAQDNGCKMMISPTSSRELTGADGMDVQIDPTDSNIFYTSQQYGSISKTTDGGATYTNISKSIPGTPTGAWTTPFVVRPDSANVIYAGYSYLYASRNYGASWAALSPAMGTNASRIKLSPLNTGAIYVLAAPRIWFSGNYGQTWASVVNPVGGGAPSDIAADPNDTNYIYVTYPGFAFYKVLHYNLTSRAIDTLNDGLPNVPVFCITIDRTNGTKYIGTSLGVWYRETWMNSWQPFYSGLPVVEVYDLKINYNTGELWAATFGRGIWKSPKDEPSIVSTVPFIANAVAVYPNPNEGAFSVSTTNNALMGKQVNISIINMAGQTVWQGYNQFDANGKLQVNASSLATGSYILQVNTDAAIAARKKITILK
jgi:hypothetical protein